MKHIIRNSCLVIFFLCNNQLAHAQSDSSYKKNKKHFFYFSPNLSVTNKRAMPGLGFTLLNKNGWGIAAEVKGTVIKAEKMPVDFSPGFVLFGDGKPTDNYAFYILSATKNVQTKNKQFVPGFTAGIVFSEKIISTNFIKNTSSACTDFSCFLSIDFNANYDYEFKKTKTAGLFLKPEVKYVFSKHIGIKLAPWVIVLPKDIYYGVECSVLIGRIK